MIGQIARTSDFEKNLLVNSNIKNYNSNTSESVIKNVNYEFGDIFNDLTTISNYRTGNINFIALSGKENTDETNGTIINLNFPKNLKEINSIKLIVAINDFEVYTSNISDSVFTKCEILENTQNAGILQRQKSDYQDGILSSHMYAKMNDSDYVKDYILETNKQIVTDSTSSKVSGSLETPSSFRLFYLNDNIVWDDPKPEMHEQQILEMHGHYFKYLANMLSGYDHCHTIISNNHDHNFSFPKHIHFVDQDHIHKITFTTHLHQVNTSHYHNISGENLFFKNLNANSINISEINKNYNISGNTEIDLTNYKSNFTNRITIKPNAKCNLTYFLLIEIFCLED